MSKPVPKFKIGFELEGVVVDAIGLTDALQRLHRDIDVGEDGSIDTDMRTDGIRRTRPQRIGTDDYGYAIYDDDDNFAVTDCEIRTPPLPLEEGIELFENILTALNERSAQGLFGTNVSTGLHVNLSEERMVQDHNLFALYYTHCVRLFPERVVLGMFRRTTNEYCTPIFGSNPDGNDGHVYRNMRLADLYDSVTQGSLGNGKYVSCGLHSNGDVDYRRIEFRCLGGKNYHTKLEELQRSLDIILDTAERAFHRTLTPTTGEIAGFKKYVKEYTIDKSDVPDHFLACIN